MIGQLKPAARLKGKRDYLHEEKMRAGSSFDLQLRTLASWIRWSVCCVHEEMKWSGSWAMQLLTYIYYFILFFVPPSPLFLLVFKIWGWAGNPGGSVVPLVASELPTLAVAWFRMWLQHKLTRRSLLQHKAHDTSWPRSMLSALTCDYDD